MLETTQRVQLYFTKGREIKYISHLDLARTMERALRRAHLPMVYSQGYNPRPRLAFASALPVGVTGREEIMDVWLTPPLEPLAIAQRLVPQLPPGIQLVHVRQADLKTPSLQSLIQWAEYEVVIHEDVPDLDARISAILQQAELPRERIRKGKKRMIDLRPLIAELWRLPDQDLAIGMRLSSSPSATGRPDDVLDAMGLRANVCDIERTRLILSDA